MRVYGLSQDHAHDGRGWEVHEIDYMMCRLGCIDVGSKVNESNLVPCPMRVVCGIMMEMRCEQWWRWVVRIVMEMRTVMEINGENRGGDEWWKMHHFICQISKDGVRVQSSIIHPARRVGMMSARTNDLNFLVEGAAESLEWRWFYFKKAWCYF